MKSQSCMTVFRMPSKTRAFVLGSLDIGFYYDGAYGKIVKSGESFLSEVSKEDGTLANPINLASSSDPVFHVENAMPGLETYGMFHIKNIAEVAFAYSVGFEHLSHDDTSDASTELISALEISLFKEDGRTVHSFTADQITDPNNLNYEMASPVLPGEESSFVVRIALDYEDVGNEIMGGELSFDLFVDARSLDA